MRIPSEIERAQEAVSTWRERQGQPGAALKLIEAEERLQRALVAGRRRIQKRK